MANHFVFAAPWETCALLLPYFLTTFFLTSFVLPLQLLGQLGVEDAGVLAWANAKAATVDPSLRIASYSDAALESGATCYLPSTYHLRLPRTTYHLPLTVTTYYVPLTTHHSPLTTHHVSLTTDYLLLTIYY